MRGSKTQDLLPHCSESMSTFQTIEAGKSTLLHESSELPLRKVEQLWLVWLNYFQLLKVQYGW